MRKKISCFVVKLLISSKDSTIQNLNVNKDILIDKIKKDNTWFKRNEKWLFTLQVVQ